MAVEYTAGRALFAQADLERLSDALAGQYAFPESAGGAVTPSSGMTLAVAAIAANTVTIEGALVSSAYAGGTVDIPASDPVYPRRDLIYMDDTGTVAVAEGVPLPLTATSGPALPTLTAAQIAIAEVYVDLDATSIAAGDITDRRQGVLRSAWELIDVQVLDTTAASISFQGIPTAFRDFRVTAYIQNDANAKSPFLRLNNDSGGNYTRQYVQGAGATASSAVAASQTSMSLVGGSAIGASNSGKFDILISKPIAGVAALVNTISNVRTGAATVVAGTHSGFWQNTSDLISRIDIVADSNSFAAGTRVVLEGCNRQ